MTSLTILFAFIFTLISIFLSVQLIRLYRRFRRASDAATAKNIYVIKYNNDEAEEDAVYETGPTADPPPPPKEGADRRRHPRKDFQGFVDFIKEGVLYKEKARDLSYSGIFIQSNRPEKYKKNDFIIMTFQTDEDGPQKRNGRIVRLDRAGIGVQFVS